MLAKQLWRLYQKQDTLIFQILKAKYFPRKDLKEASLGHQPSYLWRSILSAKDIIEEGSAWRVGNGAHIKAFADRWIGGPYPKRPTERHRAGAEEKRVFDLIDEVNKCWKEETVRELFPEEADQILATPISSRLPQDKKVWGFTTHGHFTVKSAYRVAVSMSSNERGDLLEPVPSANHWKQLWRLNIIPRMVNFMWQACNNRLPTLSNLVQRGVDLDPACRLCGESIENQTHLFIECPKTVQVWMVSDLNIQNIASMGSFQNLVWYAISNYPPEQVEWLAVVAWNIWNARNKLVFENRQWDRDDIIQRAHRDRREMRSNLWQKSSPSQAKGGVVSNGVQMRPGWLSPETDVAVPSNAKIGMGFVLRYADGKILLAAKQEARASGSSTLLEGLAMRFAISMVLEQSFDNIVVRSDSQILIGMLNGNIKAGEFEEHIVDDIKEIVKGANFKFEYISRRYNLTAHQIARGPIGVFDDDSPSIVTAV